MIVEDMEDDEVLLLMRLKQGGYDVTSTRVETGDDFVAALKQREWDIVIADYHLPGFDAPSALRLLQAQGIDLPFVIMSGAVGEQAAVEAMKAGAHDYIMKDSPARLIPAIDRELREATIRRERRKAERDLKDSYERIRLLAAHLQEVREEERKRISRDVHDELGGMLTGLKIDIQRLASELAKLSPPLAARTGEMLGMVDETVQTVRRIATDLRPGVLDNLGLSAAIEWQAKDFQTRTKIYCELAIPFEQVQLDNDRSTAVFRIFQEALTNITRHANATRVSISLNAQNGHLQLKVQDNGKGITENELNNSKSLGLLGMRERASMFGGNVEITGAPFRGTLLTLEMPVK
ncbi:MAG: histidine kinase [Blastocatellia bacterium]|nr:histidine kinase [Blastocatellia bacterium]